MKTLFVLCSIEIVNVLINSFIPQEKSLELYRHLNLKTCMWTFSAWFSMSQLVDQCGGQVVSDFQVGFFFI